MPPVKYIKCFQVVQLHPMGITHTIGMRVEGCLWSIREYSNWYWRTEILLLYLVCSHFFINLYSKPVTLSKMKKVTNTPGNTDHKRDTFLCSLARSFPYICIFQPWVYKIKNMSHSFSSSPLRYQNNWIQKTGWCKQTILKRY